VIDLAAALDILMVLALCAALLAGYPVAWTLAGVALAFAGIGIALGAFEPQFLRLLPQRVHGALTNPVFLAIPLFVLMGVVLERSKLAEDLLSAMTKALGRFPGGLGFSVTLVGAMLAASTGIVGATVVTMTLIALPVMLSRGYAPGLAAGSIAAAGTLGQIIPPSIVLILLGDAITNANQSARLAAGLAPKSVSVGDLFAGALVPGLVLVGCYLSYQVAMALLRPASSPPAPIGEPLRLRAFVEALAAPFLLIAAVLGSILTGLATPTEAAGLGALGTILLAGFKSAQARGDRLTQAGAVAALGALAALFAAVEIAPGGGALAIKTGLAVLALAGLALAAGRLHRDRTLTPALQSTAKITAMVFMILIGATLFSLVFRGLGGDETIAAALEAIPGGLVGAMVVVMALMFVLGFFLDFIEIIFVVAPLVAPPLIAMGADPVWLGVMMALNLQTSFLTPPFGFALFYLRGAAPAALRTSDLYRGVAPFILLQLAVLGLVGAFPVLATFLPSLRAG